MSTEKDSLIRHSDKDATRSLANDIVTFNLKRRMPDKWELTWARAWLNSHPEQELDKPPTE